MKTEKFKHLFNFAKKSKLKASDGSEKGEYPFYTSSTIISKRTDKAQFFDESLVFGNGGTANVHYTKEPFGTTSHCYVATRKNNEINTKYVYYYLYGNLHILERGFKGAGLKNISSKYIAEIDIPILPIETQNKIVDVLDRASSLVKKRKQTIDLLDELLRATFLDMFGDPTRSDKFELTVLSDYLEKVQIGPFGSQLHQSDYVPNEIPLINPINIIDKKIKPDFEVTITESKYNSLPNYHLKNGDIIMARRGEMGRCGLITNIEDGWFCGTGSLYLRPKDIDQSVFLLFCLTNIGTVEYLNHNAKGVTMKNLNKSIISNIPIIRCPNELQIRFAQFFYKNDNLKTTLKESLKKTQNLLLSLTQKVFNGELNFNIDFELDALVREIDLEKKENDLSTISGDIAYLQRLIDKLNAQEFEEKEMYDKAKHAVFQLLKENKKVTQEYNEKSNNVKLVLK